MDKAATAVSQWQQEIPGADYLPMEVLGRLAETALVINQRHIAPVFAQFSLQPGEFDVLATLRRSGAPFQLSPTRLANFTMMSSGGMTAQIDRLEKAGLVSRNPCPKDRRATQVGLTAKGVSLVEITLTAHLENQTRIMSSLSKSEQTALGDLLAKLLAGVSTPHETAS